MFKRFASIAHSKEFAYAYDSQAWDAHAPIESNFRMFETYGDGLCQHSPDFSVQVEFLADYLASLAQAMLRDDELCRDLFFSIWRRPSDKEIAFAASVIYKPPKENGWKHRRTYFSAKELKVSKAPSKEHDKRYEEVRDIHDGTSKSIFRILIGEYSSGLTKYIYAEAIRDWLLAHDGWMELPAEFLGWFKDDPEQREKERQLRDAYECCRNITESYRLRAAVESSLESYKRHVQPKEPEAPAPEPEAAEPAGAEPEVA
jgi:hypothetical protein